MTTASDAPWAGNPPLNLARWCLADHAEDRASGARPAFTFVHEDGRADRWSYAEVWERVQRIARGLLAGGLVPGDRVLVRLPHSPAYAFAFFGATAAGLVPVPASPQLTDEEAAFLAEDAEAAALICTHDLRIGGFRGATLLTGDLDHLDGAGALPATRAEDAAYLIYTSGTTSRPKGVLHAHRSVYGRALMRAGWQDFRASDVTLHAGTLNWSYTLGVGLMDAWAAGAHAVLADVAGEPARWPPLIRRLGVTIFAAVPTVYRQMLKYGRPEEAGDTLRHVLCAGEPLPPALLEQWRARAGTEMYEALGMTEVSTYVSTGPATPVRPGSPGRPQPGRRVAILTLEGLPREGQSTRPLPPGEVGLLAVHRSDPGLMLGYWRRPEEQAAVFRGEWFIGGDLAAIDGDGYLWFHGRADDVIKAFGYRLSPVEIEQAVESFPTVAEAAVVVHRVDEQKTLVTACIVPREGAAIDEAALAAHVARHLAEYKRPHEYVVMLALPRTPNGKLRRRALADGLDARP
ncbi:MAG: AMP-dependent synthetase [Dehalococcoidia bacterium]|nr:AMP-dependent synthetase [Dehalococcoidia bacterium]